MGTPPAGSQDSPALRPAQNGPHEDHEEKEKMIMQKKMTAPGRREAAERELTAARTELSSLSAAVSPSRFERALERVQAAQEALALAA